MFCVCGEALIDAFVETNDGSGSIGIAARPGGSPFNVAVGLARMGVATGFMGGISRDALGTVLAERLRVEGVDDRYVVRKDNPTTLSLVSIGHDGQPAYSFYGANSADVGISLADLKRLPADAEGLHFGSYTMLVPPVADTFRRLAEQERERFISYDPNVRLNVVPDRRRWWNTLEGLSPLVTLLKISAEDIELMVPGADVEDVARHIVGSGPSMVVLTKGDRGAVSFRGTGRIEVAAPSVQVLDTVGAGDAFQAQLIVALRDRGALAKDRLLALADADISEVLERAALAAAIVCGRIGADPPSRSDMSAAGSRLE